MIIMLNIFNIDISSIHNPLAPSYEAGKLISGAIGLLLLFAAIASFIVLITGGILWITSGGDKTALETARNRIVNAVIGLIIVASVWAFVSLIFPALGLSFPKISLPSIGRGLKLDNPE